MTYELEAKDILRSLVRPAPHELKQYYLEFPDTHGSRPLVLEAYDDGFNPRSVRTEYGSWFDFVAAMGDLTAAESSVRSQIGAFLGQLEIHGAGGLLQERRPQTCRRRRLLSADDHFSITVSRATDAPIG